MTYTLREHAGFITRVLFILAGFALLAANGCRGNPILANIGSLPYAIFQNAERDTVDVESFDLHKVIGEGNEKIILRFDDPYSDQVLYRVYTKTGGWTVSKATSFLRSGESCKQGLRYRQKDRIVTKWFDTSCAGFIQAAKDHNRAIQNAINQKNARQI